MKALSIAMLAAATLLAGCQREGDNLVELTGRVFVFNYRVAVATYVPGTTSITASQGSIHTSFNVTITNATLQSITVTPASSTMVAGSPPLGASASFGPRSALRAALASSG